jgi:hypothetical protein
VAVGIGISSPLKYLLDKVKHFRKSFVIFFVKKWCYWELFGNIREHKIYQRRWRGKNIKEEGKEGKWENQKKICFSSLTHTHLCLRHGAHTSVNV